MKRFSIFCALLSFGAALIFSSCDTGAVAEAPMTSYSNYDGVVIDPILTRFSGGNSSGAVVDQIVYEVRDGMRSAFRKRLRLVGAPGLQTLRVRTVVSDGSMEAPVVRHAFPRKSFRGDMGTAAGIAMRAHVSAEILDPNGRKIASISGVRIAPERGFHAASSWVEIALITDTIAEQLAGKLPMGAPLY